MDMKCQCCKHYDKLGPTHSFESGRCRQETVFKKLSGRGMRGFHTILRAQEVCDPSNSGEFKYFEPKVPGAACFVQITREPASKARNKAMAAGA